MILFGWNSYLLKSYILGELGIFDESIRNIKAEYRQKYFHLFFIPVFPLGRTWALRLNGKMYEPNADIKQVLQQCDTKTKNGIFAWSGLLGTALVLFFFSISEKLNERHYKEARSNETSAFNAFLKENKDVDIVVAQVVTINRLSDSILALPIPHQPRIDTNKILSLYLDVLLSQKDSIKGLTKENTLFICDFKNGTQHDFFDKKYLEYLQNKTATEDYYVDTASFFRDMQRVKNYKYLVLIREMTRLNGVMKDKGFSTGIAYNDVTVVDLDKKKAMAHFKSIATNSDRLSTIVFRKGSDGRLEFIREMERDLNKNSVKKAAQHIFHLDSLPNELFAYFEKGAQRVQEDNSVKEGMSELPEVEVKSSKKRK